MALFPTNVLSEVYFKKFLKGASGNKYKVAFATNMAQTHTISSCTVGNIYVMNYACYGSGPNDTTFTGATVLGYFQGGYLIASEYVVPYVVFLKCTASTITIKLSSNYNSYKSSRRAFMQVWDSKVAYPD